MPPPFINIPIETPTAVSDKTPTSKGRPIIKFYFNLPGNNLDKVNFGYLFKSFEFMGMVNGGYMIKATFFDSNYNLLSKLVKAGYLENSRTIPVSIDFQILSGTEGVYPKSATHWQTAILVALHASGATADRAVLEFTAIDPPSFYLNRGNAAGTAYTGRVDQVIKQVIQEYAPELRDNVEIGRTTDSSYNQWWMMRQDPKTFIASLLDWSSSITQKKTQWVIEVDGFNIAIKEQASILSRQRAFYRYLADQSASTVLNWELLANNSLGLVDTILTTAGISTVSGQYLDRISDNRQEQVYAWDETTQNKQFPFTSKSQAFTKPLYNAGPPFEKPKNSGWTQVISIPELYSAGDLGIKFEDYVDGRPRGMYLNLQRALMRVRFECVGHGEWWNCRGLGTDTIFIKWSQAKGTEDGGNQWYWLTGNWGVYGFHHKVKRGSWTTDVYCFRPDFNAKAKLVPPITPVIPFF